jgi:hypothetical protein
VDIVLHRCNAIVKRVGLGLGFAEGKKPKASMAPAEGAKKKVKASKKK